MKKITLPQFVTAILKAYFYGMIVNFIISLIYSTKYGIKMKTIENIFTSSLLWIKGFYLNTVYYLGHDTTGMFKSPSFGGYLISFVIFIVILVLTLKKYKKEIESNEKKSKDKPDDETDIPEQNDIYKQ